jgi:hypothetical protein
MYGSHTLYPPTLAALGFYPPLLPVVNPGFMDLLVPSPLVPSREPGGAGVLLGKEITSPKFDL